MRQSDNLNELFSALAKAQSEFKVAVFDKKSNYGPYASFKSVQDATMPALNKHGLSILQPVGISPEGRYYITTILGHSSGQFLAEVLPLLMDKQNMHGLGGAITYAKRYGWAATIGAAADDDDDATAAVGLNVNNTIPPKTPNQVKAQALANQFASEAQLGLINKKAAEYGVSPEDLRSYLQKFYEIDSLLKLKKSDVNPLLGELKDISNVELN